MERLISIAIRLARCVCRLVTVVGLGRPGGICVTSIVGMLRVVQVLTSGAGLVRLVPATTSTGCRFLLKVVMRV